MGFHLMRSSLAEPSVDELVIERLPFSRLCLLPLNLPLHIPEHGLKIRRLRRAFRPWPSILLPPRSASRNAIGGEVGRPPDYPAAAAKVALVRRVIPALLRLRRVNVLSAASRAIQHHI